MSFRNAFQTFPVLETKRLCLRQLQEPDAPICYQHLSDPQVAEFYDNLESIERQSLQSAQ